jgi:hypothetical protein
MKVIVSIAKKSSLTRFLTKDTIRLMLFPERSVEVLSIHKSIVEKIKNSLLITMDGNHEGGMKSEA